MVFDIKDGYHPVLSSITTAQTVPNDCNMEEHKTWIITGPNMGGMHDKHCTHFNALQTKHCSYREEYFPKTECPHSYIGSGNNVGIEHTIITSFFRLGPTYQLNQQ